MVWVLCTILTILLQVWNDHKTKTVFKRSPADCLYPDQRIAPVHPRPQMMDSCLVCVTLSICSLCRTTPAGARALPARPLKSNHTIPTRSTFFTLLTVIHLDRWLRKESGWSWSPFFPGPRGIEEAGCCSHYQPSHVPWASWCKRLKNWGLQGCLETGHQFLKAKLSS